MAAAGVRFVALHGAEITEADWDFFYRCYTLTYAAHHSTPYLTRDFFARVAATLPENWLLFVAERDGRRVASSLVAVDPPRGHAFGRYWGATEPIDCLHFEACYLPAAGLVASRTAIGASKAARRASTRWHRACCPPRRRRRTGSRTRSSRSGRRLPAPRGTRRRGYLDELADRAPYKSAQGAG